MTQHHQWTAASRAAFIAALAESGEVRNAAQCVGLSPQSAYRQRSRDPDFAQAWDTALLHARTVVVEELVSRAMHGWEEDVWFRGEKVGTRIRHDQRLLLALLARLDDAAKSITDERQVRRAAPHFGAIVDALAADEPVSPWFKPTLQERQSKAVSEAYQNHSFWNYAALMDKQTIHDVFETSPEDDPVHDDTWDDDEEWEGDEDEDDCEDDCDDEGDEDHEDNDTPDPLTADVSAGRGCNPVSPSPAQSPENTDETDSAAPDTPYTLDTTDTTNTTNTPPDWAADTADIPQTDAQWARLDAEMAAINIGRFGSVPRAPAAPRFGPHAIHPPGYDASP